MGQQCSKGEEGRGGCCRYEVDRIGDGGQVQVESRKEFQQILSLRCKLREQNGQLLEDDSMSQLSTDLELANLLQNADKYLNSNGKVRQKRQDWNIKKGSINQKASDYPSLSQKQNLSGFEKLKSINTIDTNDTYNGLKIRIVSERILELSGYHYEYEDELRERSEEGRTLEIHYGEDEMLVLKGQSLKSLTPLSDKMRKFFSQMDQHKFINSNFNRMPTDAKANFNYQNEPEVSIFNFQS